MIRRALPPSTYFVSGNFYNLLQVATDEAAEAVGALALRGGWGELPW